jgi:glycosyltransferase involved in cell wall biosynthesis
VARGADAFIAVSREDERRMVQVEHIDPRVIRYVPNGIPPLAPASGDVRAELGIPHDAPVVGSVGQLRPEKAFDLLLRAAGMLRGTHPALRVVIAGDGPERAHLEAFVDELGLTGFVHLLGLRRDVPAVLATLDVAVCCSPAEGSPLSVLEYMAAGVAVTATRVGGIPDLITDGVHGLLVEPGDAPALARAISTLLDDPARRAAMGDAGRTRQAEEFDIGVMIGRIQDLYLELHSLSTRTRHASGSRP